MKKIAVSLLLASCASMPTHADWVLNSDASTLSFISTKAVNIAEVHSFAMLEGTVDSDGAVRISIDLASVDTGIEIRDDRMQEMLFESGTYSRATLTAMADTAMLNSLAVGESQSDAIEGQLALHGQTMPLTFEVVVTRTSESGILVASRKPVVVNAPLFGLEEGVERLREVAGLPSISMAVPVSFVLSFDSD